MKLLLKSGLKPFERQGGGANQDVASGAREERTAILNMLRSSLDSSPNTFPNKKVSTFRGFHCTRKFQNKTCWELLSEFLINKEKMF